MNNRFVNSNSIRGIQINPRTIAARNTAAALCGYLGDKATDRIEWEVEYDESGDTAYLERDWSSLEIEEWIDTAIEEGLPVDTFIKNNSRVV